MRTALRAAMDDGTVPAGLVDPPRSCCALLVGRAENQPAARAAAGAALARLIDGLRTQPAG